MYPKLGQESMGGDHRKFQFAALFAGGIDLHRGSFTAFSGDHFLGQGIHDHPLESAFERPGAEAGVIAVFRDRRFGGVRQLDFYFFVLEPFGDLGELKIDDMRQLLIGETLKDDDVVYPVEELRPEMRAQGLDRKSVV